MARHLARRGRTRHAAAERLEGRTLLSTYTVTTSADAGPGSLRQAILDANANAGADLINGATRTVRPLSALPAVTDPVTVVSVEIDGSAAGDGTDGLVLAAGADGSVLDRVTVNRFGGSGVVVRAGGVVMKSCYVGTDRFGRTAAGNGRGPGRAAGVRVEGGGLRLQGVSSLPPTLVSGNLGDGLAVVGGGTATLERAYVGVGASLGDLGNGGHGIAVADGASLDVAGSTPGAVSVAFNSGDGIHIGPGARPGTIRRANIGTRPADGVGPNGGAGVRIVNAGGYQISACSIAFNRGPGLSIEGPLATHNVIGDNRVIMRNGSHGVELIGGATENTVGGGAAFLPITNNAGAGVYLAGAGTSANRIIRCQISGNAASGVVIDGGERNVLGGTFADRNGIGSNRGAGIAVRSGRFNDVGVNSVSGNGGLGIDLGDDGPTPNDPGDADAGPNDLQNYPVITSAVWEGDRIDVAGSIQTRPDTPVRVDLYAAWRGDEDLGGAGAEGGYYLGSVAVTTGPDGDANFTAALPSAGSTGSASLPPGGYLITATATARPSGPQAETSEFSRGVPLEGPPFARVIGVFVNGTGWSPEFRQFMTLRGGSARYGYGLNDYEDVEARRALPWVNLDEVSIGFSSDVRVEQDDLVVAGEAVPRYAVRSFTYDPYTFVATWRLAQVPAYDRVTLELASGPEGVRSARGDVPLDGEWRGTGVSGDGTPGGDYVTHFDVWRGDTDRSRRVTFNDVYLVASALGTTPRSASPADGLLFDVFRDVNGSGRVDALDWALVRASRARQPAPPPEGGTPITRGFFRPDRGGVLS